MRSFAQCAVVSPVTNITKEAPDEDELAEPELIFSS